MRLALTLCLLLFSRAFADTPLSIVEQGQSQTRIGVHPEAGEWEHRAASDLVRYIEEMSGARLPLIDQVRRPTSSPSRSDPTHSSRPSRPRKLSHP